MTKVLGVDKMFEKYNELRPLLNQAIKINEASFEHWYSEFLEIDVPEDATAPLCKNISAQIHKHFQIATTRYLAACARVSALEARAERAYRMHYASVIQEHLDAGSKPPAAATIEVLSKNAADYERGVLAVADIERQFWKTIIDQLNRARKQVETITINLGYELKVGHTAQSMGGISEQDLS